MGHLCTFENLFLKILKKHKFALISKTVRDRAKRTKFGITFFTVKHFATFGKFQKIKKNRFENTKLNYYGNALFLCMGTKTG